MRGLHHGCLAINFKLLNGGYTSAKVMLVRAIGENHAPIEPTIVKIDQKKALEKEIQLCVPLCVTGHHATPVRVHSLPP